MRHSDTPAIGRLRPPMPRRSPFTVRLFSDKRVRLETMARKYTSPYCDVIRAKIILLADEACPMMSSPPPWTGLVRLSANGQAIRSRSIAWP
jgi:hypothetical protein